MISDDDPEDTQPIRRKPGRPRKNKDTESKPKPTSKNGFKTNQQFTTPSEARQPKKRTKLTMEDATRMSERIRSKTASLQPESGDEADREGEGHNGGNYHERPPVRRLETSSPNPEG